MLLKGIVSPARLAPAPRIVDLRRLVYDMIRSRFCVVEWGFFVPCKSVKMLHRIARFDSCLVFEVGPWSGLVRLGPVGLEQRRLTWSVPSHSSQKRVGRLGDHELGFLFWKQCSQSKTLGVDEGVA